MLNDASIQGLGVITGRGLERFDVGHGNGLCFVPGRGDRTPSGTQPASHPQAQNL
jgi:hypothetical protein